MESLAKKNWIAFLVSKLEGYRFPEQHIPSINLLGSENVFLQTVSTEPKLRLESGCVFVMCLQHPYNYCNVISILEILGSEFAAVSRCSTVGSERVPGAAKLVFTHTSQLSKLWSFCHIKFGCDEGENVVGTSSVHQKLKIKVDKS